VKRRFGMIALVVVAGLPACRIDGNEQVEEVDADLLGGLNEPSASTIDPVGGDQSTSSTPGSTSTVATETISLYFIEGSQLRSVEVDVPVDASLRGRIGLLEDGPTDEAAEAGLRTALQPGLISGVALWGTDGATVKMDSAMFARIDDADQRLMIGQIVLTLDDQPDIDQVRFTVDGEPQAVFLRDNTLSEPGEAVGRSAYEVLLADPAPTVESSSATTAATRSSASRTSGP